MPITHEQARKLIQYSLDENLQPTEKATLSAHLRDCSACRDYANEIKEVEKLLLPTMKRQWDVQPVPLPIAALSEKRLQIRHTALLTMRTAAMSLVFIALFFSAWQFVLSGPSGSSRVPLAVPPVPTPSVLTTQATSLQLTLEGCAMTPYIVQENDTIASIAEHFAIPEETLVDINQLGAGPLNPSMELLIPICNFTPTGTFHAATFTTTLTPVLNHTPSIPGG